MEAQAWHQEHPVVQDLLEAPEGFHFFQAVRILKKLFAQAPKESQTVLEFKVNRALNFPHASVIQILPTKEARARYYMFVTFMGIFGQSGALPQHFSELILERIEAKDHHLVEFLDIFNQRVMELCYEIWSRNRLFIESDSVKKSQTILQFLSALTGVSPKKTSGVQDMHLYYSGLYGRSNRPSEGLRTMLEDHFRVPIQVHHFHGSWMSLNRQERTVLQGKKGLGKALGVNGLLGSRVWYAQNRFTVAVGPVNYEQFNSLLPNGKMLFALKTMVEDFVGFEYDFGIQILMPAQEVPRLSLTSIKPKQRLGWNSWLKTATAPQGLLNIRFGNASILGKTLQTTSSFNTIETGLNKEMST